MATCRSCHQNVYETFVHTGMGRSFDRATRQKSAATFGSHAVVYDTVRNLWYYPFFTADSTLQVLEYRLDKGDTIHRRLEKISYVVGSGQHTNSHILDIGGYVFQAPVTYYTQEKRWDLAPGFRENNSRFDRWLSSECLTCHNHYPTPVAGSIHKFSNMPSGIECERCHGPGKLHVEEKLRGVVVDTSRETDYSIVNPRRLPRDLQMDLCQRCHLQGVAVLEEGKTFYDFKPGMRLGEVMNVYLPRFTDTDERFIMASQADRLRMSKCFKQAPGMSCLTCHNPHRSVEITDAAHFDQACKKCHSAPAHARCTSPKAGTAPCISCHMPRSGSIDIPHVSITDHFIRKPASAQAVSKTGAKGFLGLQILTKDRPAPLDLAKGYLATFDKYLSAAVMLDSAKFYLDRLDAPAETTIPLWIHYFFQRGDFASLLEQAALFPKNKTPDGWTAYRIGEAYLKQGDASNALSFLELATKEYPLHLDFLEKKGVALVNLKRVSDAKKVFETVLAENPKRPVALCNLGYLHALSARLETAIQLYDQAIALDPDYEQALVNKAAILLFQNNQKDAKNLFWRVLQINPANRQAKDGLERLK
jgi:Flp pilus assembly protein TadD